MTAKVFVGVLLTYLVLASLRVATNRPWIDEAWFTAPALDLVVHGRLGTPLLEPTGSHLSIGEPRAVLKGITQHTYWVMPLHLLVQAAWGSVFGFTVWSMRVPAVLWGIVCLLSLRTIVVRLYGSQAAATLAAAILATEFGFLDSASDGRMDMMCAALGFAGLAIYLHLRERNIQLAIFLSHLLVAAALFTHPNGLFAAVSLVFCVFWLDRQHLNLRLALVAAIPFLAGILGWGAYALEAPSDFTAQMGANSANRGAVLLQPWRGIYEEIWLRHLFHHFLPTYAGSDAQLRVVVGLVLFMTAIVCALAIPTLRRQSGCQLLLYLTLLRFLLLSLGASLKLPYYLVPHSTFLRSSSAGIVAWHLWSSYGRFARLGVAAMLSIYLAVQLAVCGHLVFVTRGYQNKYLPEIAYLQELLRPEDILDGSSELGFAFGFYNPQLVDDLWLGKWSGRRPTVLVVDQWYYDEVMRSATLTGAAYRLYIKTQIQKEFVLIKKLDGYDIYRRRDPQTPIAAR